MMMAIKPHARVKTVPDAELLAFHVNVSPTASVNAPAARVHHAISGFTSVTFVAL
jgi:hypothetical protein